MINAQDVLGNGDVGPRFVLVECETSVHSTWRTLTSDRVAGRVTVAELPRFLDATQRFLTVCRDVAKVFWTMDKALRSSRHPQFLRLLRQGVREGRWTDFRLWQLVIQHSISSEDDCSISFPEETATLSGWIPAVEQMILCTVAIARESARNHLSPNEVLPYAAVHLGQRRAVQGAIALGRLERPKLLASAGHRLRLIRVFEDQRRDSEVIIQHEPELRRCFRPSSGAISLRGGLPDVDLTRLRKWLSTRWTAQRAAEDYPVQPPSLFNRVSTEPADWKQVAHGGSPIAAWLRFEESSRALNYLSKAASNEVEIHYDFVPRLQETDSWLGRAVQLSLIAPADGHRLGVLRFTDLDSRCLAAIANLPVPSESESLTDLNEFVAARVHVSASHRPLDTMPIATKRIAANLMLATGLRLSDQCLLGLIQESNVELDLQTIRTMREQLLDLFPPLDDYECSTGRRLGEYCGLAADVFIANQRRLSQEVHIAAVEELADMRQRRIYNVFREYCAAPIDVQARLMTAQLVDAAIGYALMDDCRSGLSPRRRSCRFGVSNAEFLDLADDFRKALLFELAVELDLTLALVDRSILILYPEEQDAAAVRLRVEAYLTTLGQSMLNSPVVCELDWQSE